MRYEHITLMGRGTLVRDFGLSEESDEDRDLMTLFLTITDQILNPVSKERPVVLSQMTKESVSRDKDLKPYFEYAASNGSQIDSRSGGNRHSSALPVSPTNFPRSSFLNLDL